MRDELKKYLYQTNDSLLHLFKWGSKGEKHFINFMMLVREELIPKGTLPMTKEEIERIKK